MVYRGRVKNGVIVINEPGEISEGTEVEVHVLKSNGETAKTEVRPWLKFSGVIDDLPPDASMRVDEILYGRPDE